MRTAYLVAYDVADEKRLRQTYKKLQGFGDPLQYSVFYCELTNVERQLMQADLWPILKFDEDRIMVVDLGPVGGRGDTCIEFWGKPRSIPQERKSVIV